MKARRYVPNLVTYCNQTPLFECYGIKCGSRNDYQKDMFSTQKKMDYMLKM